MDNKKRTIVVLDEAGNEKEAEILSAFTIKKYNKNYILYTLNEVDENEIISMVELDVIEFEKKISKKVVNTTVTMPQWLKEIAERNGINFSKALQEKLKQELDI